MNNSPANQFVKNDFNFGWKSTVNPTLGRLTVEYSKGDILDVGSATCQLFDYLNKHGWKGTYTAVDIEKYINFKYPKNVKLIIGDALKLAFPKTDTIVLYNILEHVDEKSAIKLLIKSLKSGKNVLINVPKRNEELWKNHGVAEFHQLDKTHKHNGFTKQELKKMVEFAGGHITQYHEHEPITATVGLSMWKSDIARKIIFLLSKFFKSETYNFEIWCEIVKS